MTSSRPSTGRDSSGFWRLALSLCATLALAAGALGVVGARRPPAQVSASIAAERAVAVGGQQLVLKGRQPLVEVSPDQVEVIPATPFTVTTSDSQLTLTFPQPLPYGTDYTVVVRGVTSRHTGISTDWGHTFATPDYAVYSLVSRGPSRFGAEDRVTRTTVDGSEPVTVLAAPGLEEYAVTAGTVVAIARTGDIETELVATVAADADVMRLETPPGTSQSRLRGSAEHGLVGYTVSGQAPERNYDRALFLQDVADPSTTPHEVTAAGGGPLPVVDWAFIPGTRSLVLQDDTGQVFLTGVEPGSGLVPLGSHEHLLGFLPGTTTLVVVTGNDEALLDLAAGTTTPLPEPGDAGATDILAGKRTMIGPSEWVQQFDDITMVGEVATITSRLVHTRAGSETTVATVPPDLGRLLDSGVSANGQFAWVEILTAGAPAEDLTSGATDNSVTVLIDLATGESLAAVPGAEPLWVTGGP